MSNSASLIFPHQLFQNNPVVQNGSDVYLIEEKLYFQQYCFHKKKLVLHRASMKSYEQFLISKGLRVYYIDIINQLSNCSWLIEELYKTGITKIYVTDFTDNWLMKDVKRACKKYRIELHIFETPNFLNTTTSVDQYFNKRKTYFQTDFYVWQRKLRGILITKEGNPEGGRWSFDKENRSKLPKKEIIPMIPHLDENEFIEEAKKYVETYFPNNYGNIDGPNLFVINHEDANKWLDEFLKNRLEKFGIFEDAIKTKESVLFHSVLSPLLNIGLLSPQQIIDKALIIGQEKNISLNSLEGFIRQIIGWREFIKIIYEREGSKQRSTNFWKFTRKIPHSFWSGTTGIAPIDSTIHKILQTGYCHHIERLMVLGNFMLLCEFDPNEVYKWFMEMFIDAYDWVMVPNVYGMTQFSDGGLMTTKPYISGSNYLMKMSDFEKGEWQGIWDGLFWRFMDKHRYYFLKNPRLGMLVRTFDKMSFEKKELHLNKANTFLNSLDKQSVI